MKDNKELLEDLCERLPYGVKVETSKGIGTLETIKLTLFGHELGVNIEPTKRDNFKLSECKLYLFPLSSMTEEQQLELEIIGGSVRFDYRNEDFIDFDGYSTVSFSVVLEIINWLKEHHFDYRGLIGLGLALDATGLNIY